MRGYIILKEYKYFINRQKMKGYIMTKNITKKIIITISLSILLGTSGQAMKPRAKTQRKAFKLRPQNAIPSLMNDVCDLAIQKAIENEDKILFTEILTDARFVNSLSSRGKGFALWYAAELAADKEFEKDNTGARHELKTFILRAINSQNYTEGISEDDINKFLKVVKNRNLRDLFLDHILKNNSLIDRDFKNLSVVAYLACQNITRWFMPSNIFER